MLDISGKEKLCRIKTLFENAKLELIFWKNNGLQLNFRLFNGPDPSCIGWVDTSDHTVGGILINLGSGTVFRLYGQLGVGWSRCAANSS